MEIGPSLFELKDLENDKLNVIRQCQKWGLLPCDEEFKCPKCEKFMTLCVYLKSIDGYSWNCNRTMLVKKKRKRCGIRISVRTKTFFEKSHLSLIQILAFVSMWVESYKLKHISFQLRISKCTSIAWSSFCREFAFHAMIENQDPIGGDGKVVKIDDSKFTKRKLDVSRFVRDNWVFGGIERGSGKIFMVIVEDRSRKTLIDIINTWILPGTKIISDCWRSDDENMNQSLHFVDPVTGEHTNSIEPAWRAAKISLCPPSKSDESLPGDLAKLMLVKKAKAEGMDPVLYFYKLAGQFYNPLVENGIEIRRPGEIEDLEEEIDENDD